ncbi:MAG: DUF6600 domain-containing protein [Terracidiphilus sp.]
MSRGAWSGRRAGGWALGIAAWVAGAVLLIPLARAEGAERAARLSFAQGQVRVSEDGQLVANPAPANIPLFEGAEVATAGDGEAELQFDDGSIARIAPNSSLRLAVLRGEGAGAETEIVLTSGLGYFEFAASSPLRVRFGNSVVTANGSTVARIDMDSPPGSLAVFSGNAHLERAGGALTVNLAGGDSVTLTGSDPSQYILAGSIEPDSWDAWNTDRDQALATEAAGQPEEANNLPESGNPAWNDLNANGNWYNVPGQGPVWSPYDASNPDWDPYGDGSWVWMPDYGYIWASSYSWGYLPYEFGTWNDYDDFGWGWSPGGFTPWWMGGLWESNIGLAPPGYHHPRRPHPGRPHPGQPHRGPSHRQIGHPMEAGYQGAAHPVIPVGRQGTAGTSGIVAHSRSLPLTLDGRRVQPLQASISRPQYEGHAWHVGFDGGLGNRSRPVYSGTQRMGSGGSSGGFAFGDDRPVDTLPAESFGGGARFPASGSLGFERGAPVGRAYPRGGAFPGRPYSGDLRSGRPYPAGGGFAGHSFSGGSSFSGHAMGGFDGGHR